MDQWKEFGVMGLLAAPVSVMASLAFTLSSRRLTDTTKSGSLLHSGSPEGLTHKRRGGEGRGGGGGR